MERTSLTRFAWLSILAALMTIFLKGGAYYLTGSVGLLSDALESLVNLVAAIIALIALTIAARPPDESHHYGHDKIEYFSSGVEGTLILIAAGSIIVTAVERLLDPQPIEQVGIGLVISVLASLINLAVARVLLRAGRERESITLEADAHHLMTDVWTSAGVVVGVAAVALTGVHWLDPVIALVVAANIIWAGWRLLGRAFHGLMDGSLPAEELAAVEAVLARYTGEEIHTHAMRTRQSGPRRFISMHVLVPGDWTVQQGHVLAENIEADIRKALANVTVTLHVEPLDDPASWQDTMLDDFQAPTGNH